MQAGFEIVAGSIVPAPAERANILVYAGPDDRDQQEIIQTFGLDPYELESALDPDEISRVEFAPLRVSVIWKRPKSAALDRNQVRFDVASLGLFLHRDRLVVILGEDAVPFSAREFQGIGTMIDVLLRILLHTVHHYLGHLKVIKQLTVELGSKISTSMENRYLLQMVALSESLIYYQNAIEANGTVLTNNVNVLLKKLTLINVIFLPLTLIASIGGMSEFSMMTQGIDWKISYSLLTLGMILLGWATWVALVRILDKRPTKLAQAKR
jgi:magnesium transporter